MPTFASEARGNLSIGVSRRSLVRLVEDFNFTTSFPMADENLMGACLQWHFPNLQLNNRATLVKLYSFTNLSYLAENNRALKAVVFKVVE